MISRWVIVWHGLDLKYLCKLNKLGLLMYSSLSRLVCTEERLRRDLNESTLEWTGEVPIVQEAIDHEYYRWDFWEKSQKNLGFLRTMTCLLDFINFQRKNYKATSRTNACSWSINSKYNNATSDSISGGQSQMLQSKLVQQGYTRWLKFTITKLPRYPAVNTTQTD